LKDKYQSRYRKILIVFLLAFVVLLLRAFQIQVVDDSYRVRADAVALIKYTVYPARGLIYDRNKKLLINNTHVYDLMVVYSQINRGMDTTFFCKLLGIDKESFTQRLNIDFKRDKRFSKIKPFVFMSKLTPEVYAQLQEHLYNFPGFFVQIRSIRSFPISYAAHVLGYITEVNDNDIERSDGEYVIGDYIGASGLEASYEKELRGIKGAHYMMKDNLGRDVGRFKDGKLDTKPESGYDLISTIDIDLQGYAEELMRNKKGGIVAIQPKTGEILAFVSSPTYDPNSMVIGQNRGEAFLQLQNDKNKPLFNRAIMAEYPPGSIFKALVALAGMEENVIGPETGASCSGYYVNGANDIRKCRGHPYPGNVPIALQWSCNSYFFRTFKGIVDKYGYSKASMGLDTFAMHLRDFGLGRKVGVDFPGEKSGNIPTSKFYDKIYPKARGSWRSPTIISLGIGQGEILLTTIQMANVAAAIANKGYYYIPHFAKQFIQNNKPIKISEKYRTPVSTNIKPYYFESVIDGLHRVVAAGTAAGSNIPEIRMAGKTGTVQNPHGEDHSTFIGFAPYDNPEIAIAVFVENAGGGGKFAAPIASLVMEKHLRGEINESRKFREKQIMETNLMSPRPKRIRIAVDTTVQVSPDPDTQVEEDETQN
jgi:penicillin-binding protein 2